MDFGLAKAVPAATPPSSSLTLPLTPTGSIPLTAQGTIVGTFQYMSPEQVEGKEADARSDIFSLGAVLYEMVTGKRAFEGKTTASTIAAILAAHPPSITTIQPMAPPALDRVVKTCTAKDADERWQTAHDVKLQLQWIGEGGSQAGIPAPLAGRRRNRERWAWVVAALALLAALALAFVQWRTPSRPESRAVRVTILPPEKATFFFLGASGSAALSPDGRTLAFVARTERGSTQIWVRPLDSFSARPLAGTEDANQVFWSPDSRNLGFFAQGKLKRVPAAGGPPLTLCSFESGPRGGSWNAQDVIIFGTWPGEIYSVAASGGTPEKATRFDPARRDTTHRWPHFFPDGNHFIYMASAYGSYNEDNVFYLGSLDGKVNRSLFHGSSNIAYANGYLLYVVEKALMARPFDPVKLDFTGDAVAIAEGVQYDPLFSEAVFSVSSNGVLVYQTGNASSTRNTTLLDRNGKQIPNPGTGFGEPNSYFPHFSPDGKRLASHIVDPHNGKADIWIQEVASGSRIRLTVDPARSMRPVWSRDGTRVAYYSTRSGRPVVYVKATSGMTMEQKIWEPALAGLVNDWTLDSKALILQERDPSAGKWRLVLLRLDGKGTPAPLLETPGANMTEAQLSPDGRWVTYQCDESGKDEVYISPFPEPVGRLQISVAGGTQPRWRGDGRELFYLSPDGTLMAAELKEAQALLKPTLLRPLFQTKAVPGTFDSFDVTHDGKEFLVNVVATEETPTPLSIVENWTADLKK